MEFISEGWVFLKTYYVAGFLILSATYPVLELITRITPTKKDDTLLERAGKLVRKIMDILGIPNMKKEELCCVTKPCQLSSFS